MIYPQDGPTFPQEDDNDEDEQFEQLVCDVSIWLTLIYNDIIILQFKTALLLYLCIIK